MQMLFAAKPLGAGIFSNVWIIVTVMSYVFSDDGTLSGFYADKDARIFVLQNLRACLSPTTVANTIQRKTPVSISGYRVLLTLNEPQLRDLAATVFSESLHNTQESEGILRVIRNRAALKNAPYGTSGFWGSVGGNGIDGRKTANFAQANSIPLETWRGVMLQDLQATVRALVGAADVTGGAYFWIATRIKGGDNTFGNGLQAKPPTFLITKEYGQTTFLKYNPANPVYGKRVWP